MESRKTKLVVFVDIENLDLRVFDPRVLMREMEKRGDVVSAKVYADWSNRRDHKIKCLEAGMEIVEVPANDRGKNGSDIKLAIDVMEIVCTRPYVGEVVVVSNDSDFTSLFAKVKDWGKSVVTVEVGTQALLLRSHATHCLSFKDLLPGKSAKPRRHPRPTRDLKPVRQLMRKAVEVLLEAGKELCLGDLKQILLELDPSFTEARFGYQKFSDLVEALGMKVDRSRKWLIRKGFQPQNKVRQNNTRLIH